MTVGLSTDWLDRLSDYVVANLALHFPPERRQDLERRISLAARDFGFDDDARFAAWLFDNELSGEQVARLSSRLTVGETYFWREPHVFQALTEEILPELHGSSRRHGRQLRIWSAGCATGEEPYSLAIALRRALPSSDWGEASILATDINPRHLDKARTGVYGAWSFRNTPEWLKRDYFRPTSDSKWELAPAVRRMVRFAHLNLAWDDYPSARNATNLLDVVFCRNVLMYFVPELARRTVERLRDCLVDGGWLVVAAAELSQELFASFAAVRFPDAVLYRKTSRSRLARAHAPPPPPQPAWEPALRFPSPDRPPTPAPILVEEAPPPGAIRDAQPPAPPAREDADAPGSVASSILALANQGRLAEALRLCEQALERDKLKAEPNYLRAVILTEMDRTDEAAESLRRALYLEPGLVAAHLALGNLLTRQGKTAAAKKSFAHVLGLIDERPADQVLPEAEGLTVARLREIVQGMLRAGESA